jgi:hypothetical protein
MYNRLMSEKEINVKVGDRVSVQGYRGTVTDVHHGYDTKWNGTEYAIVEGSESTSVQVHFDESDNYGIAQYGQYQDGWYGGYTIID